jgi:hypothetical protein
MVVRITEQVRGKQRVVARAHVQLGQSQVTLEVLQPAMRRSCARSSRLLS